MALLLTDAARKEIETCVHCGLCLSSCPTYKVLGQEADSPRGRIYLVKALQENRLEPEASLLSHLDLCLGCLACQAACPSGVQYGAILETAREATEPLQPRTRLGRQLRRFLLATLASPARLRRLARLLRLGQRLRLDRLAAALRLVPAHLGQMAAVLPPLPARSSRELLAGGGKSTPGSAGSGATDRGPTSGPTDRGATSPGAPGHDAPGLRVGLLLGCVQDVVFAETNQATARLLARRGCTVEVPESQACCGALHAHAGDLEAARAQARRNIDAFAHCDRVVVNAAGCGAHMKHYDRLLADDPAYAEKAREFSRKVQDLSEALAELPPVSRPGSADTPVVVYQDACHLAHAQGIKAQPRALLGQVATLKELGDDTCCGSAGYYNLVQPEMSMELLDRKMARVQATGARTLVTGNPGCLLQLRLGARRAGLDLEVLHIADYLDRIESAGEEGATRG